MLCRGLPRRLRLCNCPAGCFLPRSLQAFGLPSLALGTFRLLARSFRTLRFLALALETRRFLACSFQALRFLALALDTCRFLPCSFEACASCRSRSRRAAS